MMAREESLGSILTSLKYSCGLLLLIATASVSLLLTDWTIISGDRASLTHSPVLPEQPPGWNPTSISSNAISQTTSSSAQDHSLPEPGTAAGELVRHSPTSTSSNQTHGNGELKPPFHEFWEQALQFEKDCETTLLQEVRMQHIYIATMQPAIKHLCPRRKPMALR